MTQQKEIKSGAKGTRVLESTSDGQPVCVHVLQTGSEAVGQVPVPTGKNVQSDSTVHCFQTS